MQTFIEKVIIFEKKERTAFTIWQMVDGASIFLIS